MNKFHEEKGVYIFSVNDGDYLIHNSHTACAYGFIKSFWLLVILFDFVKFVELGTKKKGAVLWIAQNRIIIASRTISI